MKIIILFTLVLFVNYSFAEEDKKFKIEYTTPKSELFKNDPLYLNAHKNAWERYILSIKQADFKKRMTTGISIHSHCNALSPEIAGMEQGKLDAKFFISSLNIHQNEAILLEFTNLQQLLSKKKRAPLPYCPHHAYTDKNEKTEAYNNETKQ
jgi:hypothetical protein